MKRVWLLPLLLTALTSCGKEKVSYYIERQSLIDPMEWDKVISVFGYGDSNAQMCNELVKAMRGKVADAPSPAQYRCVPGN